MINEKSEFWTNEIFYDEKLEVARLLLLEQHSRKQ